MNTVVERMQGGIKEAIQLLGHATFPVLASPPFNYTVGLSDHLGYELLLLGMSVRGSNVVLNTLAFSLREHMVDLPPGHVYTKFGQTRLVLLPIPEPMHQQYTVQCYNYYGEHKPFRQVIVPDTNNKFPWEHGYDHSFPANCPMLGVMPS